MGSISTINSLWACDTVEKAQEFLKSNPNPIQLRNFISGGFTSFDHTSTPVIDSFEPKTGRLLAKVPCTQPQDVDAAIKAAKKAFPAWSKTPRTQRSAYLRRVSKLIQEHREVFAVWESIDQGKTLERARVEIDRAIVNFL